MSFVGGAVAWRLPIACQILSALCIAILVVGLPETPRWLIQQGRIDDAVQVMEKVYDVPHDDPFIVSEKEAILNAVAIETANPFQWKNILSKDPLQTGYRVFLACLVLFMNQVCTETSVYRQRLNANQT